MEYPALFEPAQEGGFVVTFPDFDWGITQGETEEEAHEDGSRRDPHHDPRAHPNGRRDSATQQTPRPEIPVDSLGRAGCGKGRTLLGVSGVWSQEGGTGASARNTKNDQWTGCLTLTTIPDWTTSRQHLPLSASALALAVQDAA